jgi:putative SOS response-associated peptidase YedK
VKRSSVVLVLCQRMPSTGGKRLDEKGKSKQAFAIARKDGEPMAFAGLWESWKDPNQSVPLETFSIITTDPNELMQQSTPVCM